MTEPRKRSPTRTERKRQAILDAAAQLFLRKGYPGTSMDEVAAHAEVAKQTVYAQFASKEALFVSMVRSMTEMAGDEVQHGMDALTSGTTVAEHLTDLCRPPARGRAHATADAAPPASDRRSRALSRTRQGAL